MGKVLNRASYLLCCEGQKLSGSREVDWQKYKEVFIRVRT